MAAQKNKKWRENHATINKAYRDLITEHGRKPTLEQVAQKTNLSVNTIHKHLKTLEFVPSDHELRILNDDVLLAIFEGVVTDRNPAMARLWVQIFNPELLMQRLGDAAGGVLREAAVLILPHNGRDDLAEREGADYQVLPETIWIEAEKEVMRLRESNKKE